MSFDLYLLPLEPDDDYETADRLIAQLFQGADISGPYDARKFAKVLIDLDSRFRPIEMDYAAIARYERISEDDARRRYDHLELNGPESQCLAQFTFCRNYIVIHWYSGTSSEEMNRYLEVLCKVSGLTVVDPQSSVVLRPSEDDKYCEPSR